MMIFLAQVISATLPQAIATTHQTTVRVMTMLIAQRTLAAFPLENAQTILMIANVTTVTLALLTTVTQASTANTTSLFAQTLWNALTTFATLPMELACSQPTLLVVTTRSNAPLTNAI